MEGMRNKTKKQFMTTKTTSKRFSKYFYKEKYCTSAHDKTRSNIRLCQRLDVQIADLLKPYIRIRDFSSSSKSIGTLSEVSIDSIADESFRISKLLNSMDKIDIRAEEVSISIDEDDQLPMRIVSFLAKNQKLTKEDGINSSVIIVDGVITLYSNRKVIYAFKDKYPFSSKVGILASAKLNKDTASLAIDWNEKVKSV